MVTLPRTVSISSRAMWRSVVAEHLHRAVVDPEGVVGELVVRQPEPLAAGAGLTHLAGEGDQLLEHLRRLDRAVLVAADGLLRISTSAPRSSGRGGLPITLPRGRRCPPRRPAPRPETRSGGPRDPAARRTSRRADVPRQGRADVLEQGHVVVIDRSSRDGKSSRVGGRDSEEPDRGRPRRLHGRPDGPALLLDPDSRLSLVPGPPPAAPRPDWLDGHRPVGERRRWGRGGAPCAAPRRSWRCPSAVRRTPALVVSQALAAPVRHVERWLARMKSAFRSGCRSLWKLSPWPICPLMPRMARFIFASSASWPTVARSGSPPPRLPASPTAVAPCSDLRRTNPDQEPASGPVSR